MSIEQKTQIAGTIVAAFVAAWVHFDAQKRGLKPLSALGWSAGVFLFLIVFLPVYLWLRSQSRGAGSAAKTPTVAAIPCPYCDATNPPKVDFCGKCGRQLRRSTEIHDRKG